MEREGEVDMNEKVRPSASSVFDHIFSLRVREKRKLERGEKKESQREREREKVFSPFQLNLSQKS